MSEFLDAMQEASDILTGKREPSRLHLAPAAVDVRAIRKRLGMTQPIFARRFGFGLATVRDWEQGRYQPDQAVRSYLVVIEREPDVVQRALQAAAA